MTLKLHTPKGSHYISPDIRRVGCRIENGYGKSSSTGGDIADPTFENENDDFWGN